MDWNTLRNESDILYGKLYNTHIEYYDLWKGSILFTWRWWIAVALVVSPWIIWLLVRKKESTDRLLYVAFLLWSFRLLWMISE